jgi:hypothetical protein
VTRTLFSFGILAFFLLGTVAGWGLRCRTAVDRVHTATAAMQEAVAHNEEAAARAAEDISTSASYQLERDLVATERVKKLVCSDHHGKGK